MAKDNSVLSNDSYLNHLFQPVVYMIESFYVFYNLDNIYVDIFIYVQIKLVRIQKF